MSTRDYKPRGSTEPKRRTPNPRGSVPRRWPWFAAGFVCGLLMAFGGILSIVGRLRVDLKRRSAKAKGDARREDIAALGGSAVPEPAE